MGSEKKDGEREREEERIYFNKHAIYYNVVIDVRLGFPSPFCVWMYVREAQQQQQGGGGKEEQFKKEGCGGGGGGKN